MNRSSYFNFNRVVIICCLLLCLSMSFLFDANVITSTLGGALYSNDLENNVNPQLIETDATDYTRQSNPTTTFPWMSILLVVYFSGVFVLFCREIISLVRLLIMIVRSEKIKNGKYTICRIADRHTAPFSWGKYIFLRDLEFDITDNIHIHEKAHTDRRHWIDVLFADLFCIILWYNPFAWMTRQLMKLNHEFEADSAVIRSGIDIYSYQRLLVTKAMGMRVMPLSNSFAADKRSFRKRVLIMSKKTSSRKPMMIAVLVVPALIISEVIVATPTSEKILSYIADYSLSKELFTLNNPEQAASVAPVVNETDVWTEAHKEDSENLIMIPNPFEDQTVLAEIIRHSLETIESDKNIKVNIEIVVDEDGNVKDVLTNDSDGSQIVAAIERQFNGIKFKQITDNGRPIEARFVIPIQLEKQ
ncbi:MAG: hypothetical protein HDR88_19065 [Bacteroides sp.]|nr:hypothetical protein [Bacteroides sp.]